MTDIQFHLIVERLRRAAEPPQSLGVLPTRALYGEAADRIEELEGALRRVAAMDSESWMGDARAVARAALVKSKPAGEAG